MSISARLKVVIVAVAGIIFGMSQVHAADMFWDMNAANGTAEIFIEGPIVPDDAERFRRTVLEIIQRKLPLEQVTIYSQGGSVQAALAIGRQIRALQLGTNGPVRAPSLGADAVSCGRALYDQQGKLAPRVHWTRNSRLQGEYSRNDDRCICTSACFLIWAAGRERHGDWIGVHRPSFDAKDFGQLSPSQASERYETMTLEVKAYLEEMGIPEGIIRKMMAASSRQMFYLSSEEARLMRDNPAITELIIARCGDAETLNLAAAAALKRQDMRQWKQLDQQLNKIWPCREQVKRQQFEENLHAYLAKYAN